MALDCSEKKDTKELCQRWMKLTESIPDEVKQKWWKIISNKYSENSRHYHTLHHIHKMFQFMDTSESYLQSSKAVAYSIYFHDLEYDPRSQENEEESIKLFENFVTDAGINDTDLIEKVKELISLTKSHCTEEHISNENFGDDDKHFFLDFDISILGSDASEYEDYSNKIKEEYGFLSHEMYNTLRIKVLKSFLQIPKIFVTKVFHDKYEHQARLNIQQEIEKLQSKT